MLDRLTDFVAELRDIGVPVSMVEVLDAAAALEHTDLSEREHLRSALGATLVKQGRHYRAFDRTFDVFFGDRVRSVSGERPSQTHTVGDRGGSGGAGDDGLTDAVLAALIDGDRRALRRLIREAVDTHAGIQPGRPVGGRYYAYRVMSRLGADDLALRLLAALLPSTDVVGIDLRIAEADAASRMEQLRSELDAEIMSRLVADRGERAVAATRRLPLIEDTDLMHATQSEIAEIERTVGPLARRLATRLSQRRRKGKRGILDVRGTIRRSLGHGGVLIDPRFKPPRRSKPELVLLCDLSGSMATFSRFTMQLAYAIKSELSKVRIFAFIDGLDEVTDFFAPGIGFGESLGRISDEADLVRRDGHSDYGSVFAEMCSVYPDAITRRSVVIVTGDARTNYRDPGTKHFQSIASRGRAAFWLNPEAERYWDTGDSVMSQYRPYCDLVEQVRTLRQLETFVERAALQGARIAQSVS